MIPGVNGGELIVIAVVALVVVGPKDLPKMLRVLGQWVGKMRRLADGFREAFDDMARQSELEELRNEIEALKSDAAGQFNAVGHEMKSHEDEIVSALNSPVSTERSTASDESEKDLKPESAPSSVIDEDPASGAAKKKRKVSPVSISNA